MFLDWSIVCCSALLCTGVLLLCSERQLPVECACDWVGNAGS
jgi:hypothetical protein